MIDIDGVELSGQGVGRDTLIIAYGPPDRPGGGGANRSVPDFQDSIYTWGLHVATVQVNQLTLADSTVRRVIKEWLHVLLVHILKEIPPVQVGTRALDHCMKILA